MIFKWSVILSSSGNLVCLPSPIPFCNSFQIRVDLEQGVAFQEVSVVTSRPELPPFAFLSGPRVCSLPLRPLAASASLKTGLSSRAPSSGACSSSFS